MNLESGVKRGCYIPHEARIDFKEEVLNILVTLDSTPYTEGRGDIERHAVTKIQEALSIMESRRRFNPFDFAEYRVCHCIPNVFHCGHSS